MLFIVFFILLAAEILIHAGIISSGIDPTPDNKRFGSVIAVTARVAYIALAFVGFGVFDHYHIIAYVLGAFFSHLALFGPMLNGFTGKRVGYLGKGTTDKLLAKLPGNFFTRTFAFVLLAAGMINGYYNGLLPW